MQELLEKIVADNRQYTVNGRVASYIPELAKVPSDILALAVNTLDGERYFVGDVEYLFSLQSISKVVTLLCALQDTPLEKLQQTISFEPTADDFNSIANLETKNDHKPLNPMINSGAIATISLVAGATLQDKFTRVLSMIRLMSNNNSITVNEDVYRSEAQTGFRNRALAYYLRSAKIIDCDVEELLAVYFKLCSIAVNCCDVANMAATLANNGFSLLLNRQLFDRQTAHIVKAIMATCGMYNGSGQFAATVGLPAKSGVGGGIMAVVPGKMGIGVLSPALDEKGNSYAGIKILNDVSLALNLSIY